MILEQASNMALANTSSIDDSSMPAPMTACHVIFADDGVGLGVGVSVGTSVGFTVGPGVKSPTRPCDVIAKSSDSIKSAA